MRTVRIDSEDLIVIALLAVLVFWIHSCNSRPDTECRCVCETAKEAR